MKAIKWAIQQPIFPNLFMFLILFSGAIALSKINREFSPVFSQDEIEITVAYPGAPPNEVEEGICIKLEQTLEDVAEISDMESVATEGLAKVRLRLKVRTDPYQTLNKIKLRVDSIENFPEQALAPQTRLVFASPTLMRFILYGDVSKQELNEISRNIREEVMDLSGVDYVYGQGFGNYEIKINVSEFSLQKYNIQFVDVSNAIKSYSFSRSGGVLNTEDGDIKIYTKNRLYWASEYGNIPIISNQTGSKILLSDVANITEGFEEEESYFRFNGKPAISMKIRTPRDANSLEICNRVREYIEKKDKTFPETLKLRLWFDRSEMITTQLDQLATGTKIGMILVVICLSCFLTFRLSFWVALGIPISFAGGFFVLFFLGKSLNLISMFALLIASGLVVDDAIIVGENIQTYRAKGYSGRAAALKGATEMVVPILGAISTTIIAFIPLFFIPGMLGNWIREIPIAVIAILVTSTIECLFILPSHLSHENEKKPNPIREKMDASIDSFINKRFITLYKASLRYPGVFLSFLFTMTLIAMGFIQSRAVEYTFFPEIDSLHIRAQAHFPPGTPPKLIDKYTQYMEKKAYELNDILPNETPIVNSMFAITEENYSYVEVQLCGGEYRKQHSNEIIQEWEKIIGKIPDALSVNFWGDNYSPVGVALEIELQSVDNEELFLAAQDLKRELYLYQGIYNIQDSTPPSALVLAPNLKEEGIFFGLSQLDVSQKLRSGFAGQEVFKIQRNAEEVNVKLGYSKKNQDLNSLNIVTAYGHELPLTSVVDFDTERAPQSISRKNKKRFLSIKAEVNTELITSARIIEKLQQKFLPELQQKYPHIKISIAGQEKENREATSYLFLGFYYALLVIFFILALILNSYIQPFIIMVVIPFGIVGSIWGHWFMGIPLSIMSLFGIVALSGIVVNDSLVLLTQINTGIKQGLPLHEAIYEAGRSRFRAILLTTITTTAGLFPLLLETSLQSKSIMPMAVSMIFGLSFSTIVTLFFIPILFVAINFIRRLVHWLKTGKWVRKEKLEPSYVRGTGKWVHKDF